MAAKSPKSLVYINCVLCIEGYREMNSQFNVMMYGIILIGITKSLMMKIWGFVTKLTWTLKVNRVVTN